MRHLCFLLVVVAAPSAFAQDPSHSDSTDYMRYRDDARELQVMTVRLDGDRYIYDLRGGDEDEAVLWTNGSAFVIHGIDAGYVKVVVEPEAGTSGRMSPSTVYLTPDQQAQQLRPAEYAFDDLGYAEVASFRVRVLRCDADDRNWGVPITDGDACRNWEPVVPESGGDDLRLLVLLGPELGGVGGGQQRPDDD